MNVKTILLILKDTKSIAFQNNYSASKICSQMLRKITATEENLTISCSMLIMKYISIHYTLVLPHQDLDL